MISFEEFNLDLLKTQEKAQQITTNELLAEEDEDDL